MLPIISEEIAEKAFNEIFKNVPEWRKNMIHYLKEENPEINTAIIEAANKTELDPKAVALGAYMAYLLIEMATKENLPLIIFTCSGGARMQEGVISLFQMAKTSQALARYKEKGLYIAVMTDPTTGGVSASFASLADITISEPNALIGFAGKRVFPAPAAGAGGH